MVGIALEVESLNKCSKSKSLSWFVMKYLELLKVNISKVCGIRYLHNVSLLIQINNFIKCHIYFGQNCFYMLTNFFKIYFDKLKVLTESSVFDQVDTKEGDVVIV